MLDRENILVLSRQLDRRQMKDYIEQQTDQPITAAQFDKLMHRLLPKESWFQARIISYLKNLYPEAFVWKAQAGPYSRQGIPDICAVIGGMFFGFEVKRPYIGRISGIQKMTIQEIKSAGGAAAVVSWQEEAEQLIQDTMEGNGRISAADFTGEDGIAEAFKKAEERDTAVKYIPRTCRTCSNYIQGGICKAHGGGCFVGSVQAWEWNGKGPEIL